MVKYDLPQTLIKHTGFFDYKKVMRTIRGWYSKEIYDVLHMPKYTQKYPTPLGTEYEMQMTGEKRVTEYVKFHMSVFMRIYDMRDIEIIQNGKKMKLQEGRIQLTITPSLELDWQKRFAGKGLYGKFLKVLDEFYRKYIIKYKIGDYWEDLILIRATNLATTIKQALGQEVM